MTKVVLVTGGTRGIGRAIARCYADAGYDVATCARRPGENDDGFFFQAGDVRDHEQVAAIVQGVIDRFGRLDVLVNNAGGSPPAAAADASPRFHDKILALNLNAPLHFCQAAHAVMKPQGGGVMVNIASVSGTRPSPLTAAYGAAKAGLINLTKTLAVEWGGDGVRVVCVTPGLVLTEQAADFYADNQDAIASSVPLNRFAAPAEIGHACVFLSSDRAAYVSGAQLVIDGGGETPAWLRAKEEG